MSSKIYFTNKPAHRNLKWHAIRTLVSTYRTFAPKKANQHLRSLLLQPDKISLDSLPAKISQRPFDSDYGQIMTYSAGEGPAVLFVHGWSGAGQQFFPMMNKVVDLGFQAISFDHYAHGRSGHHEAYLPLLIEATNEIKKHFNLEDNLAAVVSHSLGCVASLNAFSQSTIPQFLIAPVYNFLEALYSLVIDSGVPAVVLDELIESIEQQHDVDISTLDINDRIDEFEGQIQIAHDRRDRFTAYKLSQKTVKDHPSICLHTTKGLGHIRILSDPEVLELVGDFLTQANT